jgi:anion-transporting  ArsA/GET3 family ATPase
VKLDRLLGRRLLFVVGKGGVGKTTVAAALALEAARRGLRTLLIEVDGVGRAAQIFNVAIGRPGESAPVGKSLVLMNVEGSAALAEYLLMTVPVKRVLQGVLNSRIYQYFVAAAPGLKELMTVGKIWYEEQLQAGDGPKWDAIIVDAPATGHGLQYLRMPKAAAEAFGAGLVRREAKRVMDLLRDPARTVVCPVTTAEEMPVRETVEMYGLLRDELAMPLGVLFVNRVHRAPLAPADVPAVPVDAPALVADVLRAAREETGWAAINARYLGRLRDAIGIPAVELPFLFAEEFGLGEVRALRASAERQLEAGGAC